jgi:hypothetical protein
LVQTVLFGGNATAVGLAQDLREGNPIPSRVIPGRRITMIR